MSSEPDQRPADLPEAPGRWQLIRDIAVFQVKLGVDALRDLALVPVSLVAGAIDLVTGGDRPGRLFYDVLQMGRSSERWINLFADADRSGSALPDTVAQPSVDAIVERIEAMIIEQFERGGMTATAKQAIDRSLDAFAGSRAAPEQLAAGKPESERES